MDELTPFLQYGVLGFATVAIFYSFQVLQKEQTREESPRQEILVFSKTLLKYSVALTVILGAVQVYEKVIHKQTLSVTDGKVIKWSASPEFFGQPPMPLLENGMPDFDEFNSDYSEFNKHQQYVAKTIEDVISICAQNLVVSKPFISTKTPASKSQLLVLDGRALTRPVKVQIEKGLGLNRGPLGDFPMSTEYATYRVNPEDLESINIEKATQIEVLPVECI